MNKANLKKLKELVLEVRICMLTTLQSDGLLKSRPMYLVEAEEDGDLWFFNNNNGCSANEIKENPSINLSFKDLKEQRYASISGHAEIVMDKERMKALMSNIMKSWFPNGLEDKSLSLLKVNLIKAEYWETDESRLEMLFDLKKENMERGEVEIDQATIVKQ